MLFYDNIIAGLLGSEGGQVVGNKILLVGDSGCYLSDVKLLKEYSPEKIVVGLKNGGVEISGKNLYIKKYFGGDLFVCGKIIKLERL